MRLGVKFNTKKLIFLSIQVESDEKFQRVGGSTIGGATLWGKD
jgi:pantothenate kinase